jgi:AraC-like DNA-binding protein
LSDSFLVVQSILIYLAAFIGIMLLVLPRARVYENAPLSVFLLIIAIHIFLDLVIESDTVARYPLLTFPSTFIFLYGPLWFIYAYRLLDYNPVRIWMHFILMAAFVIVFIFSGFLSGPFFIAYGFQYIVYMVLVTRMIGRSSNANSLKKWWLIYFGYSFGFIWICAFLANIVSVLGFPGMADIIEIISYVFTLLFVTGLVYFVIGQTAIFMHVRTSVSNVHRDANKMPEAAILRMQKLEQKLREKDYRNPDMSREQLAMQLGLDVQSLSKEVNQYFKKSLPDLINSYRIEEAKELLEANDLSVKEIVYQVGFSSRSAFHAAFKKHAGCSTSEFRKMS